MAKYRYMIGYGVWNKADMVGWMLEGIHDHAADVELVAFVFDNCTDKSDYHFKMLAPQMLYRDSNFPHNTNVHGKEPIPFVNLGNSRPAPLDEIGVHIALMKHFYEETDLDALVVFQDDQRLRGPIFPTIDCILDLCGSRIGLIGGRSGYNHTPGKSSQWVSAGWVPRSVNEHKKYLQPGQFATRDFINTGPVVYARSMLDKVGRYLDPGFKHWFIWEDFAASCQRTHGLDNVVMDTNLWHRKFGRCTPTTFYKDGSRARDRARARQKWPQLQW